MQLAMSVPRWIFVLLLSILGTAVAEDRASSSATHSAPVEQSVAYLVRIAGPTDVLEVKTARAATRGDLQALHGKILDPEEIARYLDDDLQDLGIEGGALSLKFDANQGTLQVVSEYRVAARLSEMQIAQVREQTAGQWSDGIGENGFLVEQGGRAFKVTVWDFSSVERPWTIVASQIEAKGMQPPKPRSVLFRAARTGDRALFEEAMARGEPLDPVDADGLTPLHHALLNKQWHLAQRLVDRGANVNHRTAWGTVPLIVAAAASAPVELMDALLRGGADVHYQDAQDGRSALMLAVSLGSRATVELLLKFGANLNARDVYRGTPLMYDQGRDPAIAKLLLAAGADPQLRNLEGRNAVEEILYKADGKARMGAADLAADLRRVANTIAESKRD